jgi:hypothetical protein
MNNIIYSYTRAQAIDDGVLVDATLLAKEAGFRLPVALTRTVWEKCVTVPPAVDWQDETGRLWDVLTMLRYAIRSGGKREQLTFIVHVRNDQRPPQPITLKAVCGPGDDLAAVVTVMFPDED